MKNIKQSLGDTQESLLKDILQILARSKKGKKEKDTTHKLLPLLLDIVGEKYCMDILKVFAGKRINFPSVNSLREVYLILFIWKEINKIKKHDGINKNKKLTQLSHDFDCDAFLLYKIAKSILGNVYR